MAAAPRARRINIPLRRTAVICGAMLFALLAKVTYIQVFQADRLNENPRNHRIMMARFDGPRGEIVLGDGTLIAASLRNDDGRFRYRRTYPQGPLYAAVTGYVSLYGQTGVEEAEDAALSGDDPPVKVRSLVNGIEGGATLELTLDSRAQRAAYEALRATGRPGAAVAIDPATGAILAMASFPTYDPNVYTTFDGTRLDRADRRLRGDPADPLLNRALQQNYPPGSTFKVVTSAAALSSGKYTPTVKVGAPPELRLPGTDTYLRNSGGATCGDGNPPLAYAFKVSCNTPFAKIGIDLGQDTLREQPRRSDSTTATSPSPCPWPGASIRGEWTGRRPRCRRSGSSTTGSPRS